MHMIGSHHSAQQAASTEGRIVGTLQLGHTELSRTALRRNVPLHRLSHPKDPAGNPFVEVLTSEDGVRVIGYRFIGGRPGPCIMIAGFSPVAHAVFDRLLTIPTLPWLRGTLYMMMPDGLDQIDGQSVAGFVPDGQVDEVMFLPDSGSREGFIDAVREGYWMTLRLCARLGMIDGRGILPSR